MNDYVDFCLYHDVRKICAPILSIAVTLPQDAPAMLPNISRLELMNCSQFVALIWATYTSAERSVSFVHCLPETGGIAWFVHIHTIIKKRWSGSHGCRVSTVCCLHYSQGAQPAMYIVYVYIVWLYRRTNMKWYTNDSWYYRRSPVFHEYSLETESTRRTSNANFHFKLI